MRAVVVGAGAVGARAARQLASTDGLEQLVVVSAGRRRADEVAASIGGVATAATWSSDVCRAADVLVLAAPGDQRRFAADALACGAHVVSVVDDVRQVRALLDFDAEARERALTVAVGAGFGPGFSCVLARHAASGFDAVTEIHVAKAGTAGPACARQHHRALGEASIDWRDGGWVRQAGGSGRELCWFPSPVGGVDCYRAALPDALLLQPAFPDVERVTARVAATRRDRMTARLPMLRPPHAEGRVGVIRVEVRGVRGAVRDVRVLGAVDGPGNAAGAVAAVAATWAAEGRMSRVGAAGLAELVEEAAPFLHELARRGVRAAVFEGETGGDGSVPLSPAGT